MFKKSGFFNLFAFKMFKPNNNKIVENSISKANKMFNNLS